MQTSLVPLQIVDVEECNQDQTVGADLRRFGTGQDGHEYAIKDAVAHPLQPASEFFCYQLARICHIPVPHSEIVRLPDQTYAFGSRWEGAALRRGRSPQEDSPNRRFWASLPAHSHLASAFSSIHALDLFVSNGDRHLGNFLAANSRTRIAIYAFDFGRAWWVRWPIGVAILHAAENTVTTFAWIARMMPFDLTAACGVLDRIAGISTKDVENLVKPLTAFMLPPSEAATIYAWWGSKERAERIRHIRKYLSDGQYAR